MNENENILLAKCYIKEMNNIKEGKVPNCPLNVTIFEDQSVKNDQKSLER